jgi:hypothetical protein
MPTFRDFCHFLWKIGINGRHFEKIEIFENLLRGFLDINFIYLWYCFKINMTT